MKELIEKSHQAQRTKAARRGKAPESAARRKYYADLLAANPPGVAGADARPTGVLAARVRAEVDDKASQEVGLRAHPNR